ncbi:MAG: metallophosphoesterase [Lachnospiraceae bacterium]|nr:metallophosphoesterase [Lachnospiraceae bacterium]
MGKKVRRTLLMAVVGLMLLFGISYATNDELLVVHYGVTTGKLSEVVRFAVITDLHSCRYGEGQSELIAAVDGQQPDVVFLVGDIFDDDLPHENALTFIGAMAERYPCYYVTGNHEYWSKEVESIKQMVREAGVTVLEGDFIRLEVNGQVIGLCGVDDPTYIGIQTMEKQLESADQDATAAGLTVDLSPMILLAHRPELIGNYLPYAYDLILSGHAHGGQWRIPKLINGLMAPDQGLFPPYAGGRYEFGATTMIVSRGLARESTWVPRVFNRPELVIVDFS